MIDINKIMPKIPGMNWGAVSNVPFDDDRIKQLKRIMPNDQKWHSIFETPEFVHFDNIPIKKKDWSSMT